MIGLCDYFGFDFTANRKKIILKKDLRKYAVMKKLIKVLAKFTKQLVT